MERWFVSEVNLKDLVVCVNTKSKRFLEKSVGMRRKSELKGTGLGRQVRFSGVY